MASLSTRPAARSYESRMLAMADRLFDEFEHLPVIVVFRAIGAAQSELREADLVALPEQVERLARQRLQEYDGPPPAGTPHALTVA